MMGYGLGRRRCSEGRFVAGMSMLCGAGLGHFLWPHVRRALVLGFVFCEPPACSYFPACFVFPPLSSFLVLPPGLALAVAATVVVLQGRRELPELAGLRAPAAEASPTDALTTR